MWFHAIQLSTTFIPSRKFVYLLQYSAVDTQTHSFTACCWAILPEVDTLLTFFWSVMKGLRPSKMFLSMYNFA